jgi:hypothetical protein
MAMVLCILRKISTCFALSNKTFTRTLSLCSDGYINIIMEYAKQSHDKTVRSDDEVSQGNNNDLFQIVHFLD